MAAHCGATSTVLQAARSRRRRILFVCAYLPCTGVSAGQARMFRVIHWMAQRHDVSVLAYVESVDAQDRIEALRAFCSRVEVVLREQQPDQRDLLHRDPWTITTEFRNPIMQEKVRLALTSGRYDLVQFEFVQMACLLPQGPLAVPAVLTHHEVQHAALRRRLRQARHAWARLQLLAEWMRMLRFELRACRRFDRVIVLTEADARSLWCYDPRLPLVVNSTGVDTEHFHPSLAPPELEESGALVFVGYYRHTPNVDAMLYFCREVLPLIERAVPTVKIYVVGGSVPPELRRLHRDGRIIVTGWVDDPRALMARSQVYVVPIRTGAGIRGKIIEAWAMGKPVVATTIAAEGLRARDGENILLADPPHEFAAQVVRLLGDAPLRRFIGSNGRATAEAWYDWRLTLAAHEQIYEDVWDNGLQASGLKMPAAQKRPVAERGHPEVRAAENSRCRLLKRVQ